MTPEINPLNDSKIAAPSPKACLSVLYDGSCPLCRREVGIYKKATPSEPIAFVDISQPSSPIPAGHTREQLVARFHVQQADGSVRSGAEGFIALWSALPGWRWLARTSHLPGATRLMEASYTLFLRARPSMQRIARFIEPRSFASRTPAAHLEDLRSDHAGETGAIWIYRGALATARDPGIIEFSTRHLSTESNHLDIIGQWIEPMHRSRLLPLWTASGWLLGAVPALLGPRFFYTTIQAVETFVDRHYQDQIDSMAGAPALESLRADLEACRQDEIHHRDEARERACSAGPAGPIFNPILGLWRFAVGAGSAFAVAICRKI